MHQDSTVTGHMLSHDEEDPEKLLMAKLNNQIEEARPTGAQVLKCIKYFDLAVKIEVTMYEFQSLLSSVSMVEISAFIFGVVFFLKLMARMKNVWFFIPHLIRGVCGLILNDKMPKSHEIVKQLEIDKLSDATSISFEEIH